MTRYAIRLICFILLISQLSLFNFAQINPDSTSQQTETKLELNMPVVCESKDFDVRLGLNYYEKLLSLCRAAGNKAAISRILRVIASIHRSDYYPNYREDKLTQALKALVESQSLSEEAGDTRATISALIAIGDVYIQQRNFTRASEYLNKALSLSEAFGDKMLIARTLSSFHIFFRAQYDFDQALIYDHRELKLYEDLGKKVQIASKLSIIGSSYSNLWNYHMALEYYNKSLSLYEELGDKSGLANTLHTIGVTYYIQGYHEQSLEFFRKSLSLWEELGNSIAVLNAAQSIANVYTLQANFPQAQKYEQIVLKLWLERLEQAKDAKSRASELWRIGSVYSSRRDFDMARRSYQEVLAFETAEGNAYGIIHALWKLAGVEDRAANPKGAIEYFQKMSALCGQNINEEAKFRCIEGLTFLATAFAKNGNHAKANDFAENASSITKQFKRSSSYFHFSAYLMLGKAYRSLSQFDKARDAFYEAISARESQSFRVQGETNRLVYFSNLVEPYELYIDVLMQLHKQHPTKGMMRWL